MEALLVYPSSFACLKFNSRGNPQRICLRQWAKLRRELVASRQKKLRIRCILVQEMVGRTPLAMIRELVAVGVAATATPATSSLPAMALVMVTQMAMTAAAAMVCAAYLSPPLDEIWQKPRIIEDLPAATLIDGVDVTGYSIFQEPMVQEAIQYAKEAHAGQTRKTGEPYVTHCIHTARILAALVPSHGKRAVHTVVAGILHDVIDDTNRTLRDVEELFGDDVCKLVAGVSKLSYVNQVLRRHRRTSAHRRTTSMNGLSSAEVNRCFRPSDEVGFLKVRVCFKSQENMCFSWKTVHENALWEHGNTIPIAQTTADNGSNITLNCFVGCVFIVVVSEG